MMRRKRRRQAVNQQLLDALFACEAEWKKLLQISENSIDFRFESKHLLHLAEAKYSFLLREAKHRNISLLQ